MYSLHVHVQVMIIIISGSKKGDVPESQESTIRGCASKRGTTDEFCVYWCTKCTCAHPHTCITYDNIIVQCRLK